MGKGRAKRKGMRKTKIIKLYQKRSAIGWAALKDHFDLGKRIEDPVLHNVIPGRMEFSEERRRVAHQIFVLGQSDFRQWVTTFNRIVVRKDRIQIYLYFSGQQFFFIRQSETFRERSKVYESKKEAMAFFEMGRVIWHDFNGDTNGIP